jgi:hypothetical protein
MRTTAINKIEKGSFEADLDLAPVRACLEGWRASRKRGERIPRAIWEAVLPLARAYGANCVSKALHLDYGGLYDVSCGSFCHLISSSRSAGGRKRGAPLPANALRLRTGWQRSTWVPFPDLCRTHHPHETT